MQTIEIARQARLEGGYVSIIRHKFDTPVSELRTMVTADMTECFSCDGPIRKGGRAALTLDVYDSPFDDEPRKITVHHHGIEDEYGRNCCDLLFDTGWADFRYFECEECNRTVIRQCPSNGWHSYVRIVNECEEVCLRCYEEMLLRNGVSQDDVENGKLPGMFFSYGNPEPRKAGYIELGDRFVGSTTQAEAVCQEVLALMDENKQVVIGYESVAIGGLEGTVSLHVKEA